jgi:hypothetical protein
MMQKRSNDAVITGMGFCLPGAGTTPVTNRSQVWDIVSQGKTMLGVDGVFHGQIHGALEEFLKRFPELPDRYIRSLVDVHFYGAISLDEAANDAELRINDGDFKNAAILTARAGSDSNFDAYREWYEADAETVSPANAKDLFVRLLIAGTNNDVGGLQASICKSTGPNFTVNCGCASSSVLLGIAQMFIETGMCDLIVITGCDRFDLDRVFHGDRLRKVVELGGTVHAKFNNDPPAAPRHDKLMRPYDERSNCMNYGDGSVTLIVESRERALQRGLKPYGTIRAQHTVRSGLESAVAIDTSGDVLAEAIQRCIDRIQLDPKEIKYINGGAEGDPLFARIESNAIKKIWDDRSELLVSSQEGAFGHCGAPLGNLGAALTLLMMQQNQVCPSTNCSEPWSELTFDPVPGNEVRVHSFDYALSFNYQIGGVTSVLLLEREL